MYDMSNSHIAVEGISNTDLVSSLKEKIHKVLRPLVPSGSTVALLDFPNHSNVGDSAIWFGEKTYLRDIKASVVYTCDITTFSKDQPTAKVGNGVILLHGGGSLGDLWPQYQRFRERIISLFPDNQIVQLPQSIYFSQTGTLKQAKEIFNQHPQLTLLLRDEKSFEFARNEFRAKSFLCPDMAFALGTLPRPQRPTKQIVWLKRTDIESAWRSSTFVNGSEVHEVDWLDEAPTFISGFNRFLTDQGGLHPRRLKYFKTAASVTYDRLARERFDRGCKILSSGEVVMTDRLHGHILSLLMGIPHVCLDNIYGKLKNFYETWTKNSSLTHFANEPEEALELAKHRIQRSAEIQVVNEEK